MKAVEVLRQARDQSFVDQKGRRTQLTLRPGLTEQEISQIEGKIGLPLPPEMRELLLFTAGFDGFELDGVMEFVDFSGKHVLIGTGTEELPHGLGIATDGCGNDWVIDLTTENPEDTTVLYACHDPPVVIVQAHSIADFISEVLRRGNEPWTSSIDYVHDDCDMKIWETNPLKLTRQQALAGDADLRQFAEHLDDSYLFFDMRKAEIGQGFSLEDYDDKSVRKRFGEKRIFAYKIKSEPATKPNWFQKILGF